MPIEQAVKEIYRIEHKIEKINHKKSQSAIGLVNLNILEKQLEEYSNGLKEQFYVPEENVLDIVNDAKKEALSEYEPKEKKSIEDAQRTDNKKCCRRSSYYIHSYLHERNSKGGSKD